MILSHSCDYTKYEESRKGNYGKLESFPLIVAPLIPTATISDRSMAGNARAGKVHRYFPFPPDEFLAEDYVVDFWQMQPKPVQELLECERLASIEDEWQSRLMIGLVRFFTRKRLSDLARGS